VRAMGGEAEEGLSGLGLGRRPYTSAVPSTDLTLSVLARSQ
jgi:hypothetical protein